MDGISVGLIAATRQQSSLAVEADLHNRHLAYIRNLSLVRKVQQEKEAEAAERTQTLHKRLARHVLRQSADQGSTQLSDAASVRQQQDDTDRDVGQQVLQCTSRASDGGQAHGHATSCARTLQLPSLPEAAACKGTESTPASSRHLSRQHSSCPSNAAAGQADTAVTSSSSSSPSPRKLRHSMSLPDAGRMHGGQRQSFKSPKRRPKPRVGHASQLPPVAAGSVESRLQQQSRAAVELQASGRAYSEGEPLASYLQWRRRMKIPDHVKVFCMGENGNHSAGIRQALLARGWVENPAHSSIFYDLKWSISPGDIDFTKLWPTQVVNHFRQASCITTKLGLCKTIRGLAWHEAADHRMFYPRAYDLSEETERVAWLRDVQECAAEGIVKRTVAEGGVTSRTSSTSSSNNHMQCGPCVDLESLRLALRVCVARLAHASFLRCERQQRSTSPQLQQDQQQQQQQRQQAAQGAQRSHSRCCTPEPPDGHVLSSGQWTALLRHPCLRRPGPHYHRPGLSPTWFQRAFISSLAGTAKTARQLRTGSGKAGMDDDDQDSGQDYVTGEVGCTSDSEGATGAERCGSDAQRMEGSSSWGSASSSRPASGPELAPSDNLCSPAGSPATTSSGRVTATGGLSGGADAEAGCAVEELLDEECELPMLHVTDEEICAMDAIQALDLARQVVSALAAWYPQTHMNGIHNIWVVKPAGKSRGRGIRLFNDEQQLLDYVRGEEAMSLEWRWVVQKYVERPLVLHARKFDLRQWVLVTSWRPLTVWFWDTCYLRFAADDYDLVNLDVFLHLSNNSIAKYYTGSKSDDITGQGNMWGVPQFQQWLREQYGQEGLWEQLIQPAMQHIVVCTTRCAQELVQPRKNSFQLYGYDFLIDDELRVWLLEVNSSPTLEASTPITAQLCAEVQEDILKVVVDLPAAPPGTTPGTGRWRCIVDGVREGKVPQYTGVSLEVKGTGMAPASPKKPPAASLVSQRLFPATPAAAASTSTVCSSSEPAGTVASPAGWPTSQADEPDVRQRSTSLRRGTSQVTSAGTARAEAASGMTKAAVRPHHSSPTGAGMQGPADSGQDREPGASPHRAHRTWRATESDAPSSPPKPALPALPASIGSALRAAMPQLQPPAAVPRDASQSSAVRKAAARGLAVAVAVATSGPWTVPQGRGEAAAAPAAAHVAVAAAGSDGRQHGTVAAGSSSQAAGCSQGTNDGLLPHIVDGPSCQTTVHSSSASPAAGAGMPAAAARSSSGNTSWSPAVVQLGMTPALHVDPQQQQQQQLQLLPQQQAGLSRAISTSRGSWSLARGLPSSSSRPHIHGLARSPSTPAPYHYYTVDAAQAGARMPTPFHQELQQALTTAAYGPSAGQQERHSAMQLPSSESSHLRSSLSLRESSGQMPLYAPLLVRSISRPSAA